MPCPFFNCFGGEYATLKQRQPMLTPGQLCQHGVLTVALHAMSIHQLL
jgi:hypothetical protein